MKRRRIRKMIVAVTLALSLSSGGLIAAAQGYPPSENIQNNTLSTSASATQNNFSNGVMMLNGITPGGLRATVEAVLISNANQTTGSFNYNVITKLVLTNNSSLSAADQNFIASNLTRLTSLDLSGHIPVFETDFQNIQSLIEVKLPVNAILLDTMFNGSNRLARVVFLGATAPAISSGAFMGVNAIAYVSNPGLGGFETAEFTEHFSRVESLIAPEFGTSPLHQSVLAGQNVTFSTVANAAPNPALQWQVSTDNGRTWTNINGQTSQTLHINYVNQNQNGNQYRIIAGNLLASVISEPAVLIVNPNVSNQPPAPPPLPPPPPVVNAQNPEISREPVSVDVIANARRNHVELSVTARSRDNGTLSFQWYRNSTNTNVGGTRISSATEATFTPSIDTLGTVYYYVVVTNTNNNVNGARTATTTSRAAAVNVFTTPNAPQNPSVTIYGNQVTLNWEAPDADGGSEITGYQVSDNIVTLWIEANSDYEHTFENLFPGREYTLKVRAVNAAGGSRVIEVTVLIEEDEEDKVIEIPDEEEANDEEKYYYEYPSYDEDGGFPFLWVGLGTLAPLSVGSTILIRRKLKKAKSVRK